MSFSPASRPQSLACQPSAPQTPRPPISPPRRHSSLAFSHVQKSMSPEKNIADVEHKEPTTELTPEICIETGQVSTSRPVKDSPFHLQRILQVARGALHRDISTASSPVGSIESRMGMDKWAPIQVTTGSCPGTRAWRYSTAPQSLATISSDVREPLPSPILPSIQAKHGNCVEDEPIEPASSGFASPATGHSVLGIDTPDIAMSTDGVSNTDSMRKERNPPTNPPGDIYVTDDTHTAELNQPLDQLNIEDSDFSARSSDESPTVRHVKRRSCGTSADVKKQLSPQHSIYLSPSAEAAANSAKAKRRWLKGIFLDDKDEEQTVEEPGGNTVNLPNSQVICPNPMAHQLSSNTPCPGTLLYNQSCFPHERPPSVKAATTEAYDPYEEHFPYVVESAMTHRTTATGSPMPHARLSSRRFGSHTDRRQFRAPTMVQRREAEIATRNEHFQPGWYYAQEQSRPSPRTTYSFSTAASKLSGSDQAPDSRMRDSYKTDTLTALPVPASRYRKNGIGAELPPRGLGRYYQRPPSSARTHNSWSRPDSQQTYISGSEVRFRSSPPRASRPDPFPRKTRKRAIDDSLMMTEDIYTNNITPEMRLHASDDMMQVDDQTKAAVRMSIFGTNTPEALRQARQGIRELSPNVQLYRKGTQENQHLRKKRRPSYWDDDLKEVRESPAGRGGVRSPVSAQESMRAEFEEVSQQDVDMVTEDGSSDDQITRLAVQ